ncbi:MAG TPA: alpha/beta fold hydrolase [Solirubrobacteraceae bacterium]|jgi:pimeloyl-ACP methyl ester carboxylesterase|nr:alpha/beta fold hydrolase [Solirubrobacteraceae bacterium]
MATAEQTHDTRTDTGTRRRRMATAVAVTVVAVLVVLLVVNALMLSAETKPAHADIGFIVRLPHGDDLQAREDGLHSAPAIVLLHGFDGSLHWWDAITPALAAHHRVIRVDLLGHGGSAKPAGGYSMEHQAQLVDEALAKLGVRRALIVGHSMGGAVATALATRDRPLVAGIALVDSGARASAGQLPFIARLGFIPVIGQATRTLATNGMVAKGLSSAFAPGYKTPPRFVEDFWRMTYSSYDDSHSEDKSYLEHESLPRRLEALGLPPLVIYGTRDQLVSPASFHDYASIPGARIVAIAGSGHTPMIEKPQLTSQLLLAFAAHTLSAAPRPATAVTAHAR